MSGLAVALCSSELLGATTGLAVNFMGRYMQTGVVFSFASEFKASHIKNAHMNTLGVMYSVGPLIMAFAYQAIS